MKLWQFLSLWLFYLSSSSSLEGGAMSGSSSSLGSSSIGSTKPLEHSQPGKIKESQPLPALLPPIPASAVKATYFHPGIIVFRNGSWLGNDHLLNVSKNIGVTVSIIQSTHDPFPIDEDTLKTIIDDIFKKSGITPQTLAVLGSPPLPSFQLEILIYSINGKGYAAACDGRLFESVALNRFQLNPNDMAFQAITWEKRTLVVAPTSEFKQQLIASVKEIAETFTERFSMYERIRSGF